MTPTRVTRTIHRGILVTSMAVFATADVCADATWKTAANGDWRVDSNWVDSVPPSSAGQTYINAADAAYTVTLGSGSDVTTKGLAISGKAASYATKLNVTGTKLIVDGAKPSVGYGAVTVGTGAEFEVKNAAGATIGLGGKIEVDGGAFVMTNGVTDALAVGNSSWLSGAPTFSVKSGNAYFKGATTLMSLANYSMFSMTGGKMEMIDTSNNRNSTLIYLNGNSADTTFFSMSGDSELVFSRGGCLYLGHGVSEFKGNAKLRVTSGNYANYLSFMPYYSDSNKKVTVNVSGNATITATDLRCFELGKADFRTTGTRGVFNVSGGYVKVGICSTLGSGIGKYEMNMSGGIADFAGYGVRIGTVPYVSQRLDDASAKDLANTTTVTVAGGTLSCSAVESHGVTPSKQIWGFVVGAGLVGRSSSHLVNGWVDGRVNLQTGGTITNGCALKMFGVGRGIGTMTQTGGTYIGDSSGNYYYNGGYWRYPDSLVLGAFGGEGVYDMQGGTATLRCPLFVGGTTLGMINRTDDNNMLPANTEGKAVGTLKVSGGEMTVQNQSYVGYDGRGTIEVSGDGSLTFQSNLILTNNAANASTLRVTLADGAVPTFRIDGRLTVCDGAKLEVDAAALANTNVWAKVVDVRGGRTGSFDPANITLTGEGRIVQSRRGDSSGSIWLYRPRGMILTFH